MHFAFNFNVSYFRLIFLLRPRIIITSLYGVSWKVKGLNKKKFFSKFLSHAFTSGFRLKNNNYN